MAGPQFDITDTRQVAGATATKKYLKKLPQDKEKKIMQKLSWSVGVPHDASREINKKPQKCAQPHHTASIDIAKKRNTP